MAICEMRITSPQWFPFIEKFFRQVCDIRQTITATRALKLMRCQHASCVAISLRQPLLLLLLLLLFGQLSHFDVIVTNDQDKKLTDYSMRNSAAPN